MFSLVLIALFPVYHQFSLFTESCSPDISIAMGHTHCIHKIGQLWYYACLVKINCYCTE